MEDKPEKRRISKRLHKGHRVLRSDAHRFGEMLESRARLEGDAVFGCVQQDRRALRQGIVGMKRCEAQLERIGLDPWKLEIP